MKIILIIPPFVERMLQNRLCCYYHYADEGRLVKASLWVRDNNSTHPLGGPAEYLLCSQCAAMLGFNQFHQYVKADGFETMPTSNQCLG